MFELKVVYDEKPTNLAAMLFPWRNGGWYTALIDDGYVQFVGPCFHPPNGRNLDQMMTAIYKGEIRIEVISADMNSDGEEFLVLHPGGILRDYRFDKASAMAIYWEKKFEIARETQKKLNDINDAEIAEKQRKMKEQWAKNKSTET